MSKQKLRDLYRAPFPLYTIKIDSKTGLVITAGGGGASKTGIKNAVQFLSLELVGNQHTATLVHSHDTESCATMNMALGGDVIAAGQDGNCCLMRFREKVSKEGQSNAPKDGSGEPGNARKRGTKKQSDAGGDTVPQTKDKSVQISVEKVGEVHSDFSPLDPLQKCVRFSSDLTLLLTGGADGYLRAWEYPSLREKLNFKAHQDEIEDIDISPDNKHIVTAGRDFACSVWKNDQLVLGLRWHENMPHITDKMYRYQSCRFAEVEGQKDKLKLFTVQIPHKRERNPPPCYLTKWDGKNFLPLLTKPCGTEVISCFSVSDTGTFLGLGTVTGSVSIYSGFFLQKLYHVNESHGIVVTELAFLPNDPKSKPFKGNNEVAMLSVAVDSRCQLHNIPKWKPIPLWVLLFMIFKLFVVMLLLPLLFPWAF